MENIQTGSKVFGGTIPFDSLQDLLNFRTYNENFELVSPYDTAHVTELYNGSPEAAREYCRAILNERLDARSLYHLNKGVFRLSREDGNTVSEKKVSPTAEAERQKAARNGYGPLENWNNSYAEAFYNLLSDRTNPSIFDPKKMGLYVTVIDGRVEPLFPPAGTPRNEEKLKRRIQKCADANSLYLFEMKEETEAISEYPRKLNIVVEGDEMGLSLADTTVVDNEPPVPDTPESGMGRFFYGLFKGTFLERVFFNEVYHQRIERENYDAVKNASRAYSAESNLKSALAKRTKDLDGIDTADVERGLGLLDEAYAPQPSDASGHHSARQIREAITPENVYTLPEGSPLSDHEVTLLTVMALPNDKHSRQLTKEDCQQSVVKATCVPAFVHGTEDIVKPRSDMSVFVRYVNPLRAEIKEAVEAYIAKKDPEPLGALIGKSGNITASMLGMIESHQDFSRNDCTNFLVSKQTVEMLRSHPDILNSAKKHGLSDDALRSMEGFGRIYDLSRRAVQAEKTLISSDAVPDKAALRQSLAVIMANKVMVRKILEESKAVNDPADEEYGRIMREGAMKGESKSIEANDAKFSMLYDNLKPSRAAIAASAPGQIEALIGTLAESPLTDTLADEIIASGDMRSLAGKNAVKLNNAVGNFIQSERRAGAAEAQLNAPAAGRVPAAQPDAPENEQIVQTN